VLSVGLGLGLGLTHGCGPSSPTSTAPRTCAASEQLRVELSPEQTTALRDLFADADRPHAAGSLARVEARLQAHVGDWREAKSLACSPAPAVRECVASRAQLLAATIETLLELDPETIEFAIDAASALEPASACARADGALDGSVAPELDALRREVAKAKALARTGQVWAALEAAREASASIDAATEATDMAERPDNTAAGDNSGAVGNAPAGPGSDAKRPAQVSASSGDRMALAIDAATLLGGLLADTGDADGALVELDRAQRLARALGDPYRLLAIRNARAQVIGLRQGKTAEGLRLAQRALSDAHSLGEAAAPELAVLHETRGLLFEAEDDQEAGESAFRAALELHLRPAADGMTAPAAPAVMNHLGAMLIHRGEDSEAVALLERTVERYREDYGESHPVLALPLNNLGLAHQREGRYVEAQAALEHAVELQEESLGEDHPRLASTLDNLGLVTRKLGSFSRARECSERALVLYSQSLGPDHLRLVAPLRNLGNIARERGELGQALEHLQQALTIQERESDDARALAHALHDLANVYGRLGDLDQAEQHFARALTLLEENLGDGHPDLKGPLIGLGNIDRDRGAIDRARARYQRALDLMRDHFGDSHPEVAVALFNLGNLHKDIGRLDLAEQHYRQALAIRERALREDHPLVIKNLTTLGKTLAAEEEPKEALEVLERALILSEGKKTAAEELGALRFLIARVLWKSAEAPGRARTLAEAALASFEEAGPDYARELRTVERWLDRTSS